MTYVERVEELENEGLTTSDAQAMADMELERDPNAFEPEYPGDQY